MSPDLAARRLIMSAYLYYKLDSPVLSDGDYDALSEVVVKGWSKVDPIRRWQLGKKSDVLATGQGVKITPMGADAAHAWHKAITGYAILEPPVLSWKPSPARYGTWWAPVS